MREDDRNLVRIALSNYRGSTLEVSATRTFEIRELDELHRCVFRPCPDADLERCPPAVDIYWSLPFTRRVRGHVHEFSANDHGCRRQSARHEDPAENIHLALRHDTSSRQDMQPVLGNRRTSGSRTSVGAGEKGS